MTDNPTTIDELDAYLERAGEHLDGLRRRIVVATPADALRLELGEAWDHLRAVLEARFAVIRAHLAMFRIFAELEAAELARQGDWYEEQLPRTPRP